jgi:hypothetical protein
MSNLDDRQRVPIMLDTELVAGISVLRCPSCGFNYTHAEHSYTLPGTDEFEGGPFSGPKVASASNSGDRRSAEVILFSCEGCPNLFEVIFQQHKGNTFVESRVVPRKDPQGNPQEIEKERSQQLLAYLSKLGIKE